MINDLLQIGVWPEDSMAYVWLGVAVLLILLNWGMRVVEFLAIRYSTKCTEEKQNRFNTPQEGVSVIITVNNNEELISKNLPKFLNQNFPNFEVIVVDEASDDGSVDVLNILSSQYPNLKISRLYHGVKFHRTKKIALNIGILAAKYDILLFSEIYCTPTSENWIREMYSSFSEKVGVVVAGSRYPERGFVDVLRFNHALHTMKQMVMNYFGIVEGSDLANYGYRKSLYMACRGFSKNNQYLIGYEREMILKMQERLNIKIAFNRSKDSYVQYDNISDVLKSDEEYYYAEKRFWKWSSILLSDSAQWIRVIMYSLIVLLTLVAGYPLWFLLLLILLTFFVDFLCINLQMHSMLHKKIFITSLMSSIGIYITRWMYQLKTLVSIRRWM